MKSVKPNAYSRRWFEFFHVGMDETRTIQETAFICRCAPLSSFRKVLDVCCGMGRHARALSKQGYSVIGIDRDADVIAKARALAGGPNYMTMDIRNYRPDSDPFDAAIVMSQSFGYFDPTTNRHVLRCLALGLREGGRLILDLWNPEFFETRQGERELDTADGTVRETKRVSGGRLFVRLVYPGGGLEAFEWQLFSPKQMRSMAASVGFMPLLTCTEFNEALSACPTNPRIQFLFERDAKHRQLSFIRNDRVSH